jgi:hypothetical protein
MELSDKGYYLLTEQCNIYIFGDAKDYGSLDINNVASLAVTMQGKGYYILDKDGRVYNFGDAVDYGSLLSEKSIAKIIEVTPTGKGYYILDINGGVHAFNDAIGYHGPFDVEKNIMVDLEVAK